METTKFLGKDGLTATSANHIANIAKEMYEALEAKLASIRLYNRDYTLAVNGQTYRVENESSKEELAALDASLREIASLKSLIAWLREGIRAKERLSSDEAEAKYIRELIEAGRKDLVVPQFDRTISFASVLAEMEPDEQARYYALEAKCASLGKFIHPDGIFSDARKAYFDKVKNPTCVAGKGQDAEINTFTTSFTAEEVDAEFFALQKKYRALQAEFNRLKGEIDEKVHTLQKEYFEDRRKAMQAYDLLRREVLLERSMEVKALRIILPQGLKEVYARVSAVASAK